MEKGRKEQLTIHPGPESYLLTGLRRWLRLAHEETRGQPHPVYMVGQMRGATHERHSTGPAITQFLIEQAIHTTGHRKRRPLDPAAAWERLDSENRVPASEDPEGPLTEAARADIARNFALDHPEPIWRIGRALVGELAEQRSAATTLVAEATLAAANELALARSLKQAA